MITTKIYDPELIMEGPLLNELLNDDSVEVQHNLLKTLQEIKEIITPENFDFSF